MYILKVYKFKHLRRRLNRLSVKSCLKHRLLKGTVIRGIKCLRLAPETQEGQDEWEGAILDLGYKPQWVGVRSLAHFLLMTLS